MTNDVANNNFFWQYAGSDLLSLTSPTGETVLPGAGSTNKNSFAGLLGSTVGLWSASLVGGGQLQFQVSEYDSSLLQPSNVISPAANSVLFSSTQYDIQFSPTPADTLNFYWIDQGNDFTVNANVVGFTVQTTVTLADGVDHSFFQFGSIASLTTTDYLVSPPPGVRMRFEAISPITPMTVVAVPEPSSLLVICAVGAFSPLYKRFRNSAKRAKLDLIA